jgi:aminoglycoside phosphotransferase (APT) family kinase protein
LEGGVSAQVTALEIVLPGGERKRFVLRQHGPRDLAQNPHVAVDEFRLLSILQSHAIPAPAPHYYDESGTLVPTPYIVVAYIEGQSDFAPSNLQDALHQYAEHLSAIHRITCAREDLSFLPDMGVVCADKLSARPAKLDETLGEGRIRETLEASWPVPTRNEPVLLHGDYWPGNIIWKDERIAGVIDWEDAKYGDPLADLGNSRLEMLWAFGPEAMQSFTDYYAAIMSVDLTPLPYWDLFAALRPAGRLAEWAGSEAREREMRKAHRLFVAQAMEGISKHRA